MDVAFELPSFLILGGHQPLSGGPQVLDQSHIAKDEPGLAGYIGEQLVLGRCDRVAGRLLHGERAKRFPLMANRGYSRGAGNLGDLGVSEQDPLVRGSGRPRSRGMQLGTDPEPHVGPDGAGCLAQDAGRARQHVLHRVRPGHPVGELRENLVRGGPLSVHEPVGEPPAPVPDRLEGDGHDRRGQDRQADVALRADDRADPHHDPHVDRGDDRGQGEVDEGLVDDHVDLVEAVAEDRQGCRRGDQEGEPEAEGAGEHHIGQHRAQAGGRDRQDEEAHRDAGRVGEPFELLALFSVGPAQAHHESHDPEDEQEDDHQESGAAR